METLRFKQFHTVYQVGSLRKASEILGISHSGLSKSLRTLESELGQKLFIKSGRGVVFTDEGHEFARKIPSFFESLETLLKDEVNSGLPRLRIGSFEVFTTYFAKLLGPLFEEYELDFQELIPGKMEQALVNHEIDMAITYEPIAFAGVEHLKVSQIEMGAFVKKGSFSRTNVLKIPFAAPMIPIEGAPTSTKGLDSWPDNLIKREVKFRVDLMETAMSLARNGHCAVFIPSFVAKLHNEVMKEEFHLIKKALPSGMKKIVRDVYIVKRESTIEDAKLKKLAKYLRSL
ncbi:MAG: DNA-binding transcriptional LysR family regulator [Bacteriovoracaceae bacterium]|jgi:DNA-binding transcriptional LysR family regulator